MNKRFEHPITVPLQDIDAAGVVFFAHLFRYAHETYEHFMREIGFPLDKLISDGTFHLPLIHADADYQHPIRHGEALSIRLQVTGLSEKRFNLSYQCVDTADIQRAEISTVHVATRVGETGACPLPEKLHAVLQDYMVEE